MIYENVYRVHLAAHNTVRDVVTLDDALNLARPYVRDGWHGTIIARLSDGHVLYQCNTMGTLQRYAELPLRKSTATVKAIVQ